MQKPIVRVTWWKIALALFAPAVVSVPVLIAIVGFIVVFNFAWTQLGVPLYTGYLYSTGIITALLLILYLTRLKSPYARIWFAFPLFTGVFLVLIGIGVFGLTGAIFTALFFTLIVGLWLYISWVVWTVLAEY
ncbi:MAG: hypothetical protein ACYCZF_13240 [Anaerolineae bacterium]